MTDEDRFKAILDKSFGPNRPEVGQRAKELLNVADPYEVVLRGHSLIHAALTDALRELTTVKEMFDKTKKTIHFGTAVHLAAAFQMIDEWHVDFLMVLNAIRNTLAHNFDADVEPRDIEKLLESSYMAKEVMDEWNTDDLGRLQICIVGAIGWIQNMERAAKVQRINNLRAKD